MRAPPLYLRLAPELHRLSGDSLRLWGSAAARRHACRAILRAWDRGSGLDSAIHVVDDAVVDGLRALALERGVVAGFEVDSFGRGFTARLGYDRVFQLDVDICRALLGMTRGADSLFRTWVHESLHGRHEDRIDSATEPRLYRGFEEGLVEGLARFVTMEKAALRPREVSYQWYVAAYQRLAAVAGLGEEALWRAVWQLPRGQLRNGFVDVVDRVYAAAKGVTLTQVQRARLAGQADRQFATERERSTPGEQALDLAWSLVFR